jgi:rhodanese-related sulfurtransferase
MAVEAITKDAAKAIEYFEAKLAFEISPYGINDLISKKEHLQIIDLRTPELYAKGHVPGAVNVSYENLDAFLPKLNKDVTTVVYCYDLLCNLAAKAALHLAKKGLKVKELAGGWEEYAKQNFSQETGVNTSACSTKGGHSCG